MTYLGIGQTLRTLSFFVILFGLNSIAFAQKSILVEDDSFDPSAIGKTVTFNEEILYLVLDDSPKAFIENNVGVSRMLATATQAEGNDIHAKETIEKGSKFIIVRMYKYKHLGLETWDAGARKLYIDYSSRNPGVDFLFVLSDEKEIESTVGIANLKRSSYGKNH